MQKELSKHDQWLIKRAGRPTSSACDVLFVKPRKKADVWSAGAITYLKEKRAERNMGRPKKETTFSAGEWGNEQEVNGMEWLRQNLNLTVMHADADYDEKLFEITDFGLGDSIDGFIVAEFDHDIRKKSIEMKSPVPWSATWCHLFNSKLSEEQLREWILKEYGYQVRGHLMAYDMPCLFLVYNGRDIEDRFDTLDELDESRGYITEFTRDDFDDLDYFQERISDAAELIESDTDLNTINNL